ncbi:MAG: hypothetical protein QGH59_03945, partial [Gemmatimonadota bacterium]|nr:hypothetical protein [Gemmatimonadota bacterium]
MPPAFVAPGNSGWGFGGYRTRIFANPASAENGRADRIAPVIAATSRDNMVSLRWAGYFRADLYDSIRGS